jgi:hypothetical protein
MALAPVLGEVKRKALSTQEIHTMRNKKLLTLLIAPLFAVGMTACDVDQTEEGNMPDVEVQEGELPAYDVEARDVEITEDTVTVPDVNLEDPNDNEMETLDGGEVEGGGEEYR